MPEMFDVVELIVDLPERGLYAGMQGTIIEIHADGIAYEVEFTDGQGEALDFLALRSEQFVVVWRARTEQWVPLAELVAELVSRLPAPVRTEVLDFARFLSVRASRSNQPWTERSEHQPPSSRALVPEQVSSN